MKLLTLGLTLLLLGIPFQVGAQPVDVIAQLLLAKARGLDSRGRPDLGARTWKQVLQGDPKNAEALSALYRYSVQSGDPAGTKQYLDQLRRVQPDAPLVEPIRAPAPRDPRLRTAETLAQGGKYEEAVRVYQGIFGNEPPAGPVAVQYYETLAGVKGRADEAVLALERLLKSSPGSAEYRLALGRVQTYRPATRSQGMQLLQAIPSSSAYGARARAAWRQALVWDNGAPGSLPLLRTYLALYPDPDLEKLLMSAAVAAKVSTQSADEKFGYEALNAGNIDAAVMHFEKAIRETPRSANAYAGLGYTRMRQQHWLEATHTWETAAKMAPGNKTYVAARADARYFLAMQEGSLALEQGKPPSATTQFEAALTLRPGSQDAQRGLAGALMLGGQDLKAARIFERLVSETPGAVPDWKNLIASRVKAGERKEALAFWQKAPREVREALQKDAVVQLLLAGAYLEQGQLEEAALGYRTATQLEPGNVVAWEGWIAALMALKDDAKAFETLSGMPAEIYKEALERTGFLRSVAILQMRLGRSDVVESLLLQWIAREGVDKVPADMQVQLAGVWIQQGKDAQAEKLLRDLRVKDPNNIDATRLLLTTLHNQKRSAEALVEIKRLPVIVQAQLQQDSGYMALIAGINNDAGNQTEALRLVRETLLRSSQKGEPAQADLLLQEAWLLLDSGTDGRELSVVLRSLSSRSDLTAPQRATYLELWTVWALRQAEVARLQGDLPRATAILGDASRLFPSDAKIRSAYAGYLVQAGEHQKALAIYQTWGLADATPTEYSAAIGTAMAEKSDLARRWLDAAIRKFPSDPQILSLAGESAAQKGDFASAEIYFRSAMKLAKVQPKPQTALASVNREAESALGRLLLGDRAPEETVPPNTDRLGLVLSGDAEAGNLRIKSPQLADRALPVKSESERIADRLEAITSRNTPYFDVSTSVQSRSGTQGFDQRTLLESEIGTSRVLGDTVRVTLVARPTSIRTGASDGSSETFRLGLLPAESSFAAQSVAGLGAELQLSTVNFGLRLGAGPHGFLVDNYVAGLRLQPAGGHMTIQLTRENVKDSLLSFAGQQDPITKQVWGGVMANQAQITGNWGTERSGFYASAGYGIFTGKNVATNRSFNGNGGTYWRVLERADGALVLGLNLTGQTFEKNLRYYTLGQGGYFSPQRFYIFNVPVTWRGTYGPRLRYVINAGLGTQHFREDSSPYFPTLPSLQNVTLLSYPGQSQTGASYSLDFKGVYQLSDQWYLEGFFNLNNARNFTAQSAGFALKYGFKPRPIGTDDGPPAVPDWKGVQPFRP